MSSSGCTSWEKCCLYTFYNKKIYRLICVKKWNVYMHMYVIVHKCSDNFVEKEMGL